MNIHDSFVQAILHDVDLVSTTSILNAILNSNSVYGHRIEDSQERAAYLLDLAVVLDNAANGVMTLSAENGESKVVCRYRSREREVNAKGNFGKYIDPLRRLVVDIRAEARRLNRSNDTLAELERGTREPGKDWVKSIDETLKALNALEKDLEKSTPSELNAKDRIREILQNAPSVVKNLFHRFQSSFNARQFSNTLYTFRQRIR